MHGLRFEYQDRINFVILDADLERDRRLARRLELLGHPGFAMVTPNSDDVIEQRFGPQHEQALRAWLDEIIARYPDETGAGGG